METILVLVVILIVIFITALTYYTRSQNRSTQDDSEASSRANLSILEPRSPQSSESAAPSASRRKSVNIEIPLGTIGLQNSTGIAKQEHFVGTQAFDYPSIPSQFVIFDLETTGLVSTEHEIIEIAAIRTNRITGERKTFQSLVRPQRAIPAKITRLTGITNGMVRSEGMELVEVLSAFAAFIEDLPLVSYNAQFDIGFLKCAAEKHELIFSNRYTCALKMARRAWPGLASYRLADLAKLKNLPEDDSHRALGDCRRALLIFNSAAIKINGAIRWTIPKA